MVHDVFVDFIRSGGRFRLTGSLKGFLATCVANRARNRNKSKRNHAPGEAAATEPAAPDNERPDLATMFGEELRCVGGAFGGIALRTAGSRRVAVVQRYAVSARLPECKASQPILSKAVTATAWTN